MKKISLLVIGCLVSFVAQGSPNITKSGEIADRSSLELHQKLDSMSSFSYLHCSRDVREAAENCVRTTAVQGVEAGYKIGVRRGLTIGVTTGAVLGAAAVGAAWYLSRKQ